jgi:hypothetical protein
MKPVLVMGLNRSSASAPRAWTIPRWPANSDFHHIMKVLTRALLIEESMQRTRRAEQRTLRQQTSELA